MTTIFGLCRGASDQSVDRFFQLYPCLADPARRSLLGLKASLVLLHVIIIGVLFFFDDDLIEKTKHQPWYSAAYLLLLVVTLIQYFITASSSPGFVIDAMRAHQQENALFPTASVTSNQSASSRDGSTVITVDDDQTGRNVSRSNFTSWTKLVWSLHAPATSVRVAMCSYCNIEQPPRAKHCHDCGKCVLQFDHHCVWLGTCIGQGNHCRFWWYICGETALCLWTGIWYISYLKTNFSGAWWKNAIIIIMLVVLSISLIFLLLLLLFHSYLILTNQTTYELVRRRRIFYLRGIPERVYPFSEGVCRNLKNFCCTLSGTYKFERLPTAMELDEKSRPYTCLDFLTCRCC